MKCAYCSCTDERACHDPETGLPCVMIANDVCSVCAKELYCGYEDCLICLERKVVPPVYARKE